MSDETLRVPGLHDDESATVNRLVEKLRKHAERNRFRSGLYDGKQAIRQVGSVIPPQYYKLGLALGWAAQGVDGLARRCHLERMVWTDGDLDSLGMRELADSNFLFSELTQARTDSLIHGVSYLITTKGEEGEPAALVHAKDAMNATGDWNPRTRRLDNLLSVTSWDGDRVTGFVLYLDGVTVNVDRDGREWVVERSEHPWGVPVEPLIYRPRASRRMGRSRITRPAISHQSAALRALIRLEGHMDVYAIPQLILLGADESIFKNPDGSYKASWQIALGRVLGVPDADPNDVPVGNSGRADVKHIAAQSPEPHLADLNALAKLSAREYNLPDSDFALTDLANPTSEGAYYAGRDNLLAEAEGATGLCRSVGRWPAGWRSRMVSLRCRTRGRRSTRSGGLRCFCRVRRRLMRGRSRLVRCRGSLKPEWGSGSWVCRSWRLMRRWLSVGRMRAVTLSR